MDYKLILINSDSENGSRGPDRTGSSYMFRLWQAISEKEILTEPRQIFGTYIFSEQTLINSRHISSYNPGLDERDQ